MPTSGEIVAKRVLIVGDRSELLAAACEAAGISDSLLAVPDVDAASALATRHTPDLIVVDLPGLAAGALQEFVGAVRDVRRNGVVPLLVVTDAADVELRIAVLQRDPTDVLVRPYRAEELAVRVARLLEAGRSRRAHAASEERYRTLVEDASDGVCVIDAGGRLVEVNRALCSMLHVTAADLIGRPVMELVAAGERERVTSERDRLASGEQTITEWRVHRGDGVQRTIEVSAKRFADGRIGGIVRDITERKRVERDREALLEQTAGELTEHQLQLQSIIDTAQDGIVTIDRAGRIELFNPAAERMFGYSQAEVLGRNVRMLMPAEIAAMHDAHLERFRYTGEPTVIGAGREVTGRRKDGSEFPVEIRVGPYDDGRFSGFLRDLTERKRLEAEYLQAQKLEAVGRLAGGVAHDFNNLLAGLQSGLRIAVGMLEPGHPSTAMIREVQSEVERGAAITRRLLDFSRVEKPVRRTIDPRDTVRESEPLIRRLLAEDVDVRIECSAEDCLIDADPGTLEQILINLVINARDAMPRGGQLQIRCIPTEVPAAAAAARYPARQPGRYAVLEIRDSGSGMDAATLRRATEPFFTTKPVGLGTGLGLSTVAAIADGWGGFVEIESELHRGTTVRVHVPACLAHRPTDPAYRRVPAPSPAAPEARQATILVVEDEKLVRRGIQHVLEELGYAVVTASHAAEGLERLRAEPGRIDLLLTDVVLPGMSGPEMVTAARRLQPQIRALYMSAFPQADLVGSGRIESDATVLQKPFVQPEVAARVRAALDGDARRSSG